MSERKRKVMEEWHCPVCFEAVDEGCVPAVMNGCTPYAHVACTKCLAALQAQDKAACPKCRAPFSSFRALADFVDTDDADVAAELAKRRKAVSLKDRIDALAIEDPRIKQRVEICANRFARYLPMFPQMERMSYTTYDNTVADFDVDAAALTLDAARKKHLGTRTRYDLCRQLDALTFTVLPAMHILFPKFTFFPNASFRVTEKRLSYLTLTSNPRIVP